MCHSALAARIIDCFSRSTLTKAITSSSWHVRISLLWTDLLNQQDINNITFTGLHYASWKVSHWLSQRCFSLSVELLSTLWHAFLELVSLQWGKKNLSNVIKYACRYQMFISARFWSTSTKLFQAVQVAYIWIYHQWLVTVVVVVVVVQAILPSLAAWK